MGKLLKLICMAAVLTLFTGCSNGDEPKPDPQPVQETWLMKYDDYHSLLPAAWLDIKEDEKQKYKDLSREVTVTREGDEISIKGFFAEYPDACVKGTIKGNKVYLDNSQAIGTDNGKTVYFHWGYYDTEYYNSLENRRETWSIGFGTGTGHAFTISDEVWTMSSHDDPSDFSAIWYDKSEAGSVSYNEAWRYDHATDSTVKEGTGFPDTHQMIHIVLRKINDKE